VIPPTARQFLKDHIRSLEQLEALQVIMQSPGRWWDASSVAQAIGTDPETARRALDRFASRNLLAIRVTEDVRYQFQPGTPALAHAAAQFAEAVRLNRLAILKLVTRHAHPGIRDFADAFRIRRDDDR
jgi:DNA-binding IclR family transcriptional regulator